MFAMQHYGHNYDFVPDVPLNYICVNCNLPLKKPQQISICGHRICLQCFQNIKQESEERNVTLVCPFDEENIDSAEILRDVSVERELSNWNVKCPNSINFCMWVGPLKQVEEHKASCRKDNSKVDEVILKEEMHMLCLKVLKLESKLEENESRMINYEHELKICKDELLSKSQEIRTLKALVLAKIPNESFNIQNKVLDTGISVSSREKTKPLEINVEKKPNKKNSVVGGQNKQKVIEPSLASILNSFEFKEEWAPTKMLELGMSAKSSPKVKYKRFVFQFMFQKRGSNLEITLHRCGSETPTPFYKCSLMFMLNAGSQLHKLFVFDLSIMTAQTKKFPNTDFLDYAKKKKTIIFIGISQ